MGDRTYASITIYECAVRGEAEALLAVLSQELIADGASSDDLIVVATSEPVVFFNDQASCGTVEIIGNDLAKAAPHATFQLTEEPAYSHLGETFIHVPRLGVYRAECDPNGIPVFTMQEIMGWLETSDSVSVVGEIVKGQCGHAWFTHLGELKALRDGPSVSTTAAPNLPPSNYPASFYLEAHLLDAHGQDVRGVERGDRALETLRQWHDEAHAEGRTRYPHTHNDI